MGWQHFIDAISITYIERLKKLSSRSHVDFTIGKRTVNIHHKKFYLINHFLFSALMLNVVNDILIGTAMAEERGCAQHKAVNILLTPFLHSLQRAGSINNDFNVNF